MKDTATILAKLPLLSWATHNRHNISEKGYNTIPLPSMILPLPLNFSSLSLLQVSELKGPWYILLWIARFHEAGFETANQSAIVAHFIKLLKISGCKIFWYFTNLALRAFRFLICREHLVLPSQKTNVSHADKIALDLVTYIFAPMCWMEEIATHHLWNNIC